MAGAASLAAAAAAPGRAALARRALVWSRRGCRRGGVRPPALAQRAPALLPPPAVGPALAPLHAACAPRWWSGLQPDQPGDTHRRGWEDQAARAPCGPRLLKANARGLVCPSAHPRTSADEPQLVAGEACHNVARGPGKAGDGHLAAEEGDQAAGGLPPACACAPAFAPSCRRPHPPEGHTPTPGTARHSASCLPETPAALRTDGWVGQR